MGPSETGLTPVLSTKMVDAHCLVECRHRSPSSALYAVSIWSKLLPTPLRLLLLGVVSRTQASTTCEFLGQPIRRPLITACRARLIPCSHVRYVDRRD